MGGECIPGTSTYYHQHHHFPHPALTACRRKNGVITECLAWALDLKGQTDCRHFSQC